MKKSWNFRFLSVLFEGDSWKLTKFKNKSCQEGYLDILISQFLRSLIWNERHGILFFIFCVNAMHQIDSPVQGSQSVSSPGSDYLMFSQYMYNVDGNGGPIPQ